MSALLQIVDEIGQFEYFRQTFGIRVILEMTKER